MKYLYIIALGDKNADHDMYLLDDYDVELYETGYYEEREKELLGIDPTGPIEPTISNGDWGWLCSAYSPVYASDGTLVCHIGCDVDMEQIMTERRNYFITICISSFVFAALVLSAAIHFTGKIIVKPLRKLTEATGKFKPSENSDYEKAGVVELKFKRRDEISGIYEAIRSMQMNIVDYINDLSSMEKDNKRYMTSLKDKEEKLGRMSKEVYLDPLTGVGSKAAYIKKSDELTAEIAAGTSEFAIAMVDLNDLKLINDKYGHRSGDLYIKGCACLLTETFKTSSVFRIGGDEFVIVLQGEDFEKRHELTEQLKAKFAVSRSDENAEPHERYSAAIGLAEHASDDNTVELVFKRADKKMYEDKMAFKQKNGSYR